MMSFSRRYFSCRFFDFDFFEVVVDVSYKKKYVALLSILMSGNHLKPDDLFKELELLTYLFNLSCSCYLFSCFPLLRSEFRFDCIRF